VDVEIIQVLRLEGVPMSLLLLRRDRHSAESMRRELKFLRLS
jgi:hypothetical protein